MVPTPFYLGVIGSRRRASVVDRDICHRKIFEYHQKYGPNLTLVSGGCPTGGDRFAERYAELYEVPIIIFRPDKSQLPPNPTRLDFTKINYARNRQIAFGSSLILALVAEDRKGGTENTIRYAREAKCPVILL